MPRALMYAPAIPGLFLAVPLTTPDRDLDHHIKVFADDDTGLKQVSYAMTEQIRAVSDQRAGRNWAASAAKR